MAKKGTIGFFDKMEDKIRAALSRHPLIYSLVGSVGIILLWRGIWILADHYHLDAWLSTVIGLVILMSTGLLVSFFVGDQIIISGIKQEKRIDEKTEEEIKKEEESIAQIKTELEYSIKARLDEIEKHIHKSCEEIKDAAKNRFS